MTPKYGSNVGLNKGIKEMGCEDLNWVNLVDDRIQLRAFVTTVAKRRIS